MSNPEVSAKRCAIIGAGVSGLASAKWALEYKIVPVIFEKANSTCGIWQYKPEDVESGSVMKSTILNSSKEMNAFSDFPPDKNHSLFMHNREFLKHLNDYIEHYNLAPFIRLRHEVVSIQRSSTYALNGQWIVRYQKLDCGDKSEIIEEIFDAVLLCTGHTTKPNRQPMEQSVVQQFKGRILHACAYKNPKEFEDQTTIVVGLGNSATDIAVELSRSCKMVYLSTRSGAWVFRRTVDSGKPLDMDRFTRFKKYILPLFLPQFVMERTLRSFLHRIVDHEKCGLSPNRSVFARLNIMNDELPGRILCGTITVKPDILEYLPNGVIWRDGNKTEGIDNILFATGYIFDTKLVENGKLISVVNDRANLYKNVFPVELADHNTLGIIGLQYTSGSAITPPELQARLFFGQLTGAVKLPSKTKILKICENEMKQAKKRHGDVIKNIMLVDVMRYMDDISSLIGCSPPNIFWTALTDPRLAWALAFGPNVSYVYRLRGPHAWSGARDAILGVEYRANYSLYKAAKARGLPIKTGNNCKKQILGLCATAAALIVVVKLYTLYR